LAISALPHFTVGLVIAESAIPAGGRSKHTRVVKEAVITVIVPHSAVLDIFAITFYGRLGDGLASNP